MKYYKEDVKLGDFIDTRKGYAFKSKWYTDEGTQIVKVSDFTADSVDTSELVSIPTDIAEKYQKYGLTTDDVIVQTVGSWPSNPASVVGKVIKVPSDANNTLLNQNAVKLIPNGEIDKGYLFYLLKSPKFKEYIVGTAQGAASQASITLDSIRGFKFNLPHKSTQQNIASILSAFDDLIENNTRRIEILEEMARRIYREWFVHFRYPGHQEDKLVDSGTDEFDIVPEDWDMLTMEEILEHYIGGTWGQEEPEGEENNPAYVIRGTDIPGARVGNVDEVPLRFHKQSYINSRKLQDGDIVFEVSGGSKDQPVGRAMLITDTFLSELDCDDVVHASFCKLLRPDKSILKPEILYLHIREIYDDRRIMKYQVQSTGITNFKFSFFAANKLMFISPIEIQEKFQEIVRPLFKQMYTLGKQNNRLKETRDLLLPKLISGKIDIEEMTIV